MAKQTKTTYECDGCGADTPRKQLRQFRVDARKYGVTYSEGHSGWIDLCDLCEESLIVALGKAGVAGDQLETLRREGI